MLIPAPLLPLLLLLLEALVSVVSHVLPIAHQCIRSDKLPAVADYSSHSPRTAFLFFTHHAHWLISQYVDATVHRTEASEGLGQLADAVNGIEEGGQQYSDRWTESGDAYD